MSASAFRRSARAVDRGRSQRILIKRLVDEHVGLLREVTRLRAAQRLTYRDPLTGLGTRRYLEARLSEELSRAQRNASYRGSLILMELDDAEAVGRRHGSAISDRAERWVAKVLGETLRAPHIACRIGAGCFAAILCDTDLPAAAELVARVHAVLARARGHRWAPCDMNVGAAAWPADGERASGLLTMANIRLVDDRRRRGPRPGAPLVLLP
jgi:diguanylate cyclase (GGDEF)-like protein